MTPSDEALPGAPRLRELAEARLASAAGPTPASEKLLHELQVHQLELEMQNEALRQTQSELEESRDRYRDLYESAPVGYLTLAGDGSIGAANLMAVSLLGGERGGLLGRDFSRFIAPEDCARWRGQFRAALDAEIRCDCELTLLRGDGARCRVRLDCLGAAGGEGPAALRIAIVDIDELARVHRALARSEEHYRRLARISPAGILHADAEGMCAYVNARWCEISGLSVAASMGRGWRDSLHPEDRGRALDSCRRARTARQPNAVECRLSRADGKACWVLAEIVAELDGQGRVIGYLGVVSDITERHEREQRRLLGESLHRDALVREVHHRIKNTLQSVSGLLRRELGKFTELDSRLEVAITQMRAIAVVHGLQSSSTGEAVGLGDTTAQICEIVASQTRRAIHWECEEAAATSAPMLIARDEAVAVALVINELVLNAAKHAPADASDVHVRLSVDAASARLSIRNALAGRRRFDFDSGAGLDTGLRLVRSLMPEQGATLRYADEADSALLTELTISAPLLRLRKTARGR